MSEKYEYGDRVEATDGEYAGLVGDVEGGEEDGCILVQFPEGDWPVEVPVEFVKKVQ